MSIHVMFPQIPNYHDHCFGIPSSRSSRPHRFRSVLPCAWPPVWRRSAAGPVPAGLRFPPMCGWLAVETAEPGSVPDPTRSVPGCVPLASAPLVAGSGCVRWWPFPLCSLPSPVAFEVLRSVGVRLLPAPVRVSFRPLSLSSLAASRRRWWFVRAFAFRSWPVRRRFRRGALPWWVWFRSNQAFRTWWAFLWPERSPPKRGTWSQTQSKLPIVPDSWRICFSAECRPMLPKKGLLFTSDLRVS